MVGSGTGGPGSVTRQCDLGIGLGTAGSQEGRGGALRGPSAVWAPPGRSRTPSPVRPPQNASRDLLGEALAQHIRQQMDARGDHPLDHYSLAGAWTHKMGTAHVSVLGEDGSAVAATSTINTPCVGLRAVGAPGRAGRPRSVPWAWSPAPTCCVRGVGGGRYLSSCLRGPAPGHLWLKAVHPVFLSADGEGASHQKDVLRGVDAGPGRLRGGAEVLWGWGQGGSLGAGPGRLWGRDWGGAREGSAVPACWGRPLKRGAPGLLWESGAHSRRPAPPLSAALEPWCTHHARASFSTTSFWTCAGGTHKAPEPRPRPVSTGPNQPRVREGGPVWRRWVVDRALVDGDGAGGPGGLAGKRGCPDSCPAPSSR